MRYTVADADWTPGLPLTPGSARSGTFRRRSEAERVAEGRPILALSVYYDATRGRLVAPSHVGSELGHRWSAPAFLDDWGTAWYLAPIPAALIRVIGPSRSRVDPGGLRLFHPHETARGSKRSRNPFRRVLGGRARLG